MTDPIPDAKMCPERGLRAARDVRKPLLSPAANLELCALPEADRPRQYICAYGHTSYVNPIAPRLVAQLNQKRSLDRRINCSGFSGWSTGWRPT